MASAESFLWTVVSRIEPTALQKEAASRSHGNLRDLLNSGQMANRIVDSYLSGSYARDTALRPIEDVDVIFLIRVECWQSELEKLTKSLPSPSKVLESFANAIRYRYAITPVFDQRRSVRLSLYHLDIDVVPAIPVTADGKTVRIPDSESQNWIVSAPKIHEEFASYVNQMQSGRFKPLVKLLKFWNANLPESSKLKSFTVETIAVRLFQTIKFSNLQEGLIQFFDFVCYLSGQSPSLQWRDPCAIQLSLLGITVPDASGTGCNVAAGINASTAWGFVQKAKASRDKMLAAHHAIFESDAISRVREVLGA